MSAAWQSVGSDVWIRFTGCLHEPEQHSGMFVRFGGEAEDEGYDRDDICVGAVKWCSRCAGKTWKLESLDPLHVEPSIETTCTNHPKRHGHIRDGKWVEVKE